MSFLKIVPQLSSRCVGSRRQPGKRSRPFIVDPLFAPCEGRRALRCAFLSRRVKGTAMSIRFATSVPKIWFEPMHAGQKRAFAALANHRFKALRCGRRFGKTALAMSWAAKGLVRP